MAEPKTKPTDKSVEDFLSSIEPEQKRLDGFELLKIFKQITGDKAVMWGDSMIGFGKYHYKSERSSQEGDWLLTGFSPRKQNLTLYVMAGNNDSQELFNKLGKHKTSMGCLYINKLSDVDMHILTQLIEKSYHHMKKTTKS
jgi:hypothetical protein